MLSNRQSCQISQNRIFDCSVKGMDETKETFSDAELNRFLREQRFQGIWSKILRALIVSTIAWLIWKPLGTLIAIVALGESREPLQRGAVFWSPLGAIWVGIIVGTSVAIFVWTLAHFAVHSIWARCFFGVEGLMAATYFGFGINPSYYLRSNWENKLMLAQFTSAGMYVFGTAIFWLWIIIQKRP